MEREDALSRLPPAYARALCLRADGMDDETIAAELDLPVEAVRSLLMLAERKVARIIALDR